MIASNHAATFDFEVHTNEVNVMCELSVARLLDKLIHVASQHAASLGFGQTDLMLNNHTWVLARMRIALLQSIPLGQTYRVTTWVESVNRRFTTRRFLLHDTAGTLLGHAASVWSIIDFATRQSIDILSYATIVDRVADYPTLPLPVGKISALPSDHPIDYMHRVRVSELDINAHMTSIQYVAHLIDTLPLTQFQTHRVADFEIHFLQEALYDESLSLHRLATGPDNHIIEMRSEGLLKSRCQCQFASRNE